MTVLLLPGMSFLDKNICESVAPPNPADISGRRKNYFRVSWPPAKIVFLPLFLFPAKLRKSILDQESVTEMEKKKTVFYSG